MTTSFADRLAETTHISAEERRALDRLEEGPVEIRKGEVIQRDESRAKAVYVVHRGQLLSYSALDDGSRQIYNIYLSGDLIGASAVISERANETVVAIEPSVVSLIEKSDVKELMTAHPRLVALLFAIAQADRQTMADRLKQVGRQSAKTRIAAFLVEMRDRTLLIDDAGNAGGPDSFSLAVTQEDMGDLLGLTPVHVNRMLRELERDGLIERAGRKVVLKDVDTLRKMGNYRNRYDELDLDWLFKPDQAQLAANDRR